MKRVLMLAYYFPPSKAAGTFRTLRFVRGLPACGWKPAVLTVRPDSYHTTDLDLALLHKIPNEIPVHRTPAPSLPEAYRSLVMAGKRMASLGGRARKSPFPNSAGTSMASGTGTRPGGETASLSETLFMLCRTPDIDSGWYAPAILGGLAAVARERPQVIYATGGPWTTFLVARDVSRLTGVPLVLDYRDPWTRNPSVRRYGDTFERLAVRLEKSVLRRARYVVANTDVLRETLLETHGKRLGGRTIVIHNSFDESDFESPAPAPDGVFTLRYVGALYDAHSPGPFLRSLAVLLSDRPALRGRFRVHLVGVGAGRVAETVRALGLEDTVAVEGPVPHAEAVRLQRAAHALLLFLTVQSEHSTFVPSKLFEYVAARRPIFAVTGGGALERLLRGRHLTPWVYRPEDARGMAEGLANLLDRHERGCLPALSEEIVRSFSGGAATRALAGVLEAAAAGDPLRPYAEREPVVAESSLHAYDGIEAR